MSRRLDNDLAALEQLAADCDWLSQPLVVGRDLGRVIRMDFHLRAFAWRRGDPTPVIRCGDWPVQFLLARDLVVQPLVRILPDADVYLPAGANIVDWSSDLPPGVDHPLPGLVCYAEEWNPQLTLAWLAYQTARIVVGEVLNLEARPLSVLGRDLQAAMLAQGQLPTQVIAAPPPEILCLNSSSREPLRREIEIHDH